MKENDTIEIPKKIFTDTMRDVFNQGVNAAFEQFKVELSDTKANLVKHHIPSVYFENIAKHAVSYLEKKQAPNYGEPGDDAMIPIPYRHLKEAFRFSCVHGQDNDELGTMARSLYQYLRDNIETIEEDVAFEDE